VVNDAAGREGVTLHLALIGLVTTGPPPEEPFRFDAVFEFLKQKIAVMGGMHLESFEWNEKHWLINHRVGRCRSGPGGAPNARPAKASIVPNSAPGWPGSVEDPRPQQGTSRSQAGELRPVVGQEEGACEHSYGPGDCC
jgi:hypothetical protein